MGSGGPRNNGSCPYGDRESYCDEIESWRCYESETRSDCCDTCFSNRLSPPIPVPGCEYGDKRAKCDTIQLNQCYENTTRDECCYYCHDHKFGPAGCEYGNKVLLCDKLPVSECYEPSTRDDCCQYCEEHNTGPSDCPYGDRIESCLAEACKNYSQNKRTYQCCRTCGPAPTAGTSPGPGTSTPYATAKPRSTTNTSLWTEEATESTGINGSLTSDDGGGNKSGVIIGASLGALCLVLIIIIVFICWRKRRNQGPKHLSPITETMYNEYKMSKRAPVPQPRDEQRPKSVSKQKLIKQDSEVYAYINPEDVESIPSKTGSVINPQNGVKRQSRNEDDPLPPTPGDYLELKVVDKYGYMEPVEKHKNKPNPYSEPYSDNSAAYVSKGGDPPYKNISK